jgi:hypothetical protein
LAVLAICLIYAIRGRRRVQGTATLFLWRRALAHRSSWSRFRPWVAAAWRSLVVVFLAVGLAMPMLGPKQIEERSFVFVLDGTASMQATDVAPSRFEQAKSDILALAGNLGSSDRAALIVVGVEPHVAHRLTNQRADFLAAVKSAKPCDASGDARRGIGMAKDLMGAANPARVIVFTDSNIDDEGDERVEVKSIGGEARNVGFTSIASRPPAEAESDQRVVVVHLQSFGADPVASVTVRWRNDGESIDETEVPLVDGKATIQKEVTGNLIEVEISEGDHLALDNHAAIDLVGLSGVDFGQATNGNVHVDSQEASKMRAPDATVHGVAVGQSVFGPLDQHGPWRWSGPDGKSHTWHANLVSAAESNIAQPTTARSIRIEPARLPAKLIHNWFLAIAVLLWVSESLACALGGTE